MVFNALNSVVEEMSLTFEYSAWSSILSQCRDFSLRNLRRFDAAERAVRVRRSSHPRERPARHDLGRSPDFFDDEIYEGDVIMVNSTYFGSTHIGDLVVACPVFYEGEHLFWAAAHGSPDGRWVAVRDSVPVQATDIWKEGFQISPIKLEERGRLRKDVLELYLSNMRYRDFIYGDLMSQMGR